MGDRPTPPVTRARAAAAARATAAPPTVATAPRVATPRPTRRAPPTPAPRTGPVTRSRGAAQYPAGLNGVQAAATKRTTRSAGPAAFPAGLPTPRRPRRPARPTLPMPSSPPGFSPPPPDSPPPDSPPPSPPPVPDRGLREEMEARNLQLTDTQGTRYVIPPQAVCARDDDDMIARCGRDDTTVLISKDKIAGAIPVLVRVDQDRELGRLTGRTYRRALAVSNRVVNADAQLFTRANIQDRAEEILLDAERSVGHGAAREDIQWRAAELLREEFVTQQRARYGRDSLPEPEEARATVEPQAPWLRSVSFENRDFLERGVATRGGFARPDIVQLGPVADQRNMDEFIEAMAAAQEAIIQALLRRGGPMNTTDAPVSGTAHMMDAYALETVIGIRFLYDYRRMWAFLRALRRFAAEGARTEGVKVSVTAHVALVNASDPHAKPPLIVPVVSPTVLFRNPAGLANRQEGNLAGQIDYRKMVIELAKEMLEGNYVQSGMVVVDIARLDFVMARVSQIPGGGSFIPVPECIVNKKCVLNVRNVHDDLCAKYSVALALLLLRGEERPSNYDSPTCSKYLPIIEDLNWSGMEFPTAPKDWVAFERHNPTIGVFVYEPVLYRKKDGDLALKSVETNRVPTNRATATEFVYLLLLSDGTGQDERLHYVTISNLSRLFNTRSKRNACICPFCVNPISGDPNEHMKKCKLVADAQLVFPKEQQFVSFQNVQNKLKQRVFITVDFECRMQQSTQHRVSRDEDVPVTMHLPISFGIHVHNMYDYTENQPKKWLDCPTVIFHDPEPATVVRRLVAVLKDYGKKIHEFLADIKDNRVHNFAQLRSAYRARPGECCYYCELPLTGPEAAVPDYCKIKMNNVQNHKGKKQKKKKVREQTEEYTWYEEEASEEEEEEEEEELLSSDEDEVEEESRHRATAKARQKDADETRTDLMWYPVLDYLNGDFHGFAHQACINRVAYKQRAKRIPAFFHNGMGYDNNVLLQYLDEHDLDQLEQAFCIMKTSSRFARLDIIDKISIVDSMQHLNASIASLVDRLTNKGTAPDNCKVLANFLPELLRLHSNADEWKLFTRKGVFPYEWLDSYDKMHDRELPAIEDFTTSISGPINTEEYNFAQQVWRAAGCETFADYHNAYLYTDVLLLADVLSAYRDEAHKHFKLDPLHYASLSACGWDSMLRESRVRLQLISDPNLFLLIEESKRGGLAVANQPYTVAQNKYTRKISKEDESMEEKADDTFLANLDCTALYGSNMKRPLPVRDFEWVESEGFDLGCLCQEPGIEHMLKVDLHIPPKLHDKFDSFPPAPERTTVKQEWLSDEQRAKWEEMGEGQSKTEKLIASLMDKKEYVVYSPTLKLYLELGVVVTKIHKVVRFVVEPFMNDFIDKCIDLRKQAQRRGDAFYVDLWKLWVNSCFGTSIRNDMNHVTVMLTSGNNSERISRAIRRNTYQRAVPIGAKLWVLIKSKMRRALKHPIYVGCYIMDIAKEHMYKMWYKVLQPYFGVYSLNLLYMDTDSFIFQVYTGDLHRAMAEIDKLTNGGRRPEAPGEGVFDMSSLDPAIEPEYYNACNSKHPFTFKDEQGSSLLLACWTIRSKMYYLASCSYDGEVKKSKTVAKGVPRQCHTTLDFRKCYETHEQQDVEFVRISCIDHQMVTVKLNKKGLSSFFFNDKRVLYTDVDDAIVSRAFGYIESDV